MVATLISFTLLTSLALNIDRSRSVLVIKWVYQLSSHSTTNIDEIASFKNLALNEIPAIEQRLKEQSEIGLLREQSANYSLSLAGKLFVAFANFLSNILKLNGYKTG
jgi:predicted transcriptional regulator